MNCLIPLVLIAILGGLTVTNHATARPFETVTDGTGFTTLHHFPIGTPVPINLQINSDGIYPRAGLILSANTLYRTASEGGSMGYGTLFRLSLLPQLTITRWGTNVVLTWPANALGFFAPFILQSTTNPASPAVWNTLDQAPVVVDGHNVVTNSISGVQKLYRLSQ